MRTLLTTSLALLAFAGVVLANDKALDVSKAHLNNFIRAEYKKLENTYAPRVVLMPGHEFLKIEYGLADAPGRKKAKQVERAKLIAAMTKASAGRPDRPADKVTAMMASLKFEVIDSTAGDFVFPPSDPVGTPDSKLHFTIKKGDVLVKAAPPKGDYILFQLRQVDGAWRIVAEYLD